VIVAVDDCEHLLIKKIEELVHHFGEVEFAAKKVSLEFDEKVTEHVRVLLVDHAVGLLEHLMETVTGLCEKLLKKFWNEKGKVD
jgi:hypothetical protein